MSFPTPALRSTAETVECAIDRSAAISAAVIRKRPARRSPARATPACGPAPAAAPTTGRAAQPRPQPALASHFAATQSTIRRRLFGQILAFSVQLHLRAGVCNRERSLHGRALHWAKAVSPRPAWNGLLAEAARPTRTRGGRSRACLSSRSRCVGWSRRTPSGSSASISGRCCRRPPAAVQTISC